MNHELTGKCGEIEVKFNDITEAVKKDYILHRDTGKSYQFYYNKKRIERFDDLSFEEEIDFLTSTIKFMDNFSTTDFTGVGCTKVVTDICECGGKNTRTYYIYDDIHDTFEVKNLCKDCVKELKQLGYRVEKTFGVYNEERRIG